MATVRRTAVWWRWLLVPWTEGLLASTIVAAAATPVFLVVSADVWRATAEDDITASAVDTASLEGNGVDIAQESRLDAGRTERADAAVRDGLAAIPELAEPDLTIYTLPGLLAAGSPVRPVGPTGRLFARAGAVDAIDVVDELPVTDGGVYVTTWFAARHDLALGDLLGFEAGAIADEEWNDIVRGGGTSNVLPIVGLYEPLWSPTDDAELTPYWESVAPELVPRFIEAFDGPNSELIIADATTVLASGLTGVVRWRAPLDRIPDTFDGLLRLRSQMRRFELATVEAGELGDALVALAASPGGRPRLGTDLFDTTAEVVAAVGQLDAPLDSARGVGAVLGLTAMVAVGAFFVERRRSEFRLLASEGEQWPTMTARVASQLAAPVALGAAIGIGAGVLGPWWLGPAERAEHASVPWGGVALAAATSLVLASTVAGVTGARTLRTAPLVAPRVLLASSVLMLAGAVGFTWVQAGRTTAADGSGVDLTVVVLPVLSLLLAISLATAITTSALRSGGHRTERLPTAAFLALRRLAVGARGLPLVAAGIGLGVGLLVFSVALTSTLDRTVDVKLASQIGGESSLAVLDPLPVDVTLPDRTTVLRSLDSLLTPGGGRARVLAIDPATFADAVTWPEAFGARPDEVLELLRRPVEGAVSVVGVTGEPAPTRGAFGLSRTVAYVVVDRVGSLPGADGSAITLLVDAGSLDRLAFTEAGYATREEAVADGFVMPTVRFRHRLVSQAPIDELVEFAERAGVRVRDPVSLEERSRDAGVVAARAAFGYLAVLGIAAAVAALVALGLFLEARRRARALSGVMARTMGLPPLQAALVTTLELVVVLVISVSTAFGVVPFVVRRLSPRFDPAPAVPPADVGVLADWGSLVVAAVVAISVVATAVLWAEWRAGRRPAGEVLRRGR